MRKLALPFTVVAALLLVGLDTSSAEARGCRSYSHYGGHGVHYGGRGLHIGFFGPRAFGGFPVWHDTTHLHWHPSHFRRHGDHYDYIPGHYDVHRTGHWHWFGW